MTTKICDICNEEFTGHGHQPHPYKGDKCCDNCHSKVIHARFLLMEKHQTTVDAVVDEIKSRLHPVDEIDEFFRLQGREDAFVIRYKDGSEFEVKVKRLKK